MSEVTRYWIHWNDQLYVADKNGDLVMAEDFDRVTAERDGLQISLNTADQSIDELNAAISRRTQRVRELEALLTAADERADQAETIIRKWKAIFGESMARRSELYMVTDDFLAALKPAEGGRDEAI